MLQTIEMLLPEDILVIWTSLSSKMRLYISLGLEYTFPPYTGLFVFKVCAGLVIKYTNIYQHSLLLITYTRSQGNKVIIY